MFVELTAARNDEASKGWGRNASFGLDSKSFFFSGEHDETDIINYYKRLITV